MVCSVAEILSGLCAKSSMTVIPFAVPDPSSRRRMPLKPLRCAAASLKRHAARLGGAQGGERIGDIVQAGNIQLHVDGLARVARFHLERDACG